MVFGPETSLGLVQLFFDQLVQELAAAAPAEPAARASAGGEFRARTQREPALALRTVTGCRSSTSPTREITCKIVYYGPGRSGKTTNLQYIYGRVPESAARADGVARHPDATARCSSTSSRSTSGSISGFTTRFQLYTVPGQVYYNATRKLVLQGADGVVFVADSQARRFDENLESLQNLQDNLLEQGVDIRTHAARRSSTTSRTCRAS